MCNSPIMPTSSWSKPFFLYISSYACEELAVKSNWTVLTSMLEHCFSKKKKKVYRCTKLYTIHFSIQTDFLCNIGQFLRVSGHENHIHILSCQFCGICLANTIC